MEYISARGPNCLTTVYSRNSIGILITLDMVVCNSGTIFGSLETDFHSIINMMHKERRMVTNLFHYKEAAPDSSEELDHI